MAHGHFGLAPAFLFLFKESLDFFFLDGVLREPVVDDGAHQNVLGGIVDHALNIIAFRNFGFASFLQQQCVAGQQMADLRFKLRRAFLSPRGVDADKFFLLSLGDRLAVDGEVGGRGHGAGGGQDGGAADSEMFDSHRRKFLRW